MTVPKYEFYLKQLEKDIGNKDPYVIPQPRIAL